MRRATHEGFGVRASIAYQPLQEKESALLVAHMLRDAQNWNDNLKRSSASAIFSAVYGWLPIDESVDALVERINKFLGRITLACTPGAYLVEIFSAMQHLPDWMARWKREGRMWFKEDTKMFEGFMDDVRVRMVGPLRCSVPLHELC